MRNRILILTIALLVFRALSAQKTPHPEYLMRYYFTAAEGAKQSVIPSKDLLKIKGIGQKQYFSCFPQEGLRFNQFLSQVQTGYDTIYAIEEMVSCSPLRMAFSVLGVRFIAAKLAGAPNTDPNMG